MSQFNEKTIKSETIFEGKIISLRVEDVLLPNGVRAKRELVTHPGAVAILAITPDQKLIFVEQFRKALDRSIVEIPAGKVERGEDPKVTAMRELEEETGYRANHWEPIQSFATSPGFADEVIHLYLATSLEKVDHPAQGDEDELIYLHEISLQEAEKWMRIGKIYDAKTAFAILYAKSLSILE